MNDKETKEMNFSEMLFNRDERLLDCITNLQSNWNSLREWLLKDTKDTFFEVVRIKDILDKMNELEGKDKEC